MTGRERWAAILIGALLALPGPACAQRAGGDPARDGSEAKPRAKAAVGKGKATRAASAKGKARAGATKGQETGMDQDKAKAEADANATSKPGDDQPKLARATFGGGCFWCLEAVFERVKGVKSVVSGYAGGQVKSPSYDMVCTGLTGHAEVVQITYDPEVVSFDELLHVFWKSHDPTTLNRQGPDYGTQYRSIILYHDDDQRLEAQKSIQELTRSGAVSSPVVTEVVPLTAFYPAEAYHQDYYRKHPYADYCLMYIAPKVEKMKAASRAGRARPH